MADLTITAASVVPQSGAKIDYGTAGATITAGQVLYQDPADLKWKLADNNSGTADVRKAKGLAVNGAASGQPVAVVRSGPVAMGAILTAGVAYYLSDTAGGICPVADVGAGEYVSIVGLALSTSVLDVRFQNSGVAL